MKGAFKIFKAQLAVYLYLIQGNTHTHKLTTTHREKDFGVGPSKAAK